MKRQFNFSEKPRRVFIAEINTLHVADTVSFICDVGQINTLLLWPLCRLTMVALVKALQPSAAPHHSITLAPSAARHSPEVLLSFTLPVVQRWRHILMTFLSPCRRWTSTKRRWPGGKSASSPLTKTHQGLIRSSRPLTWSGRSGTSGSR